MQISNNVNISAEIEDLNLDQSSATLPTSPQQAPAQSSSAGAGGESATSLAAQSEAVVRSFSQEGSPQAHHGALLQAHGQPLRRQGNPQPRSGPRLRLRGGSDRDSDFEYALGQEVDIVSSEEEESLSSSEEEASLASASPEQRPDDEANVDPRLLTPHNRSDTPAGTAGATAVIASGYSSSSEAPSSSEASSIVAGRRPTPSPPEGAVAVTTGLPAVRSSRGAYAGFRWNGPDGTATHIRVDSPSGESTGKIKLGGKKDPEAIDILKRLSVRAVEPHSGTTLRGASRALTGKEMYLTAFKKNNVTTAEADAIRATFPLEEVSDGQPEEGAVPVTRDLPNDSRGPYGGVRWNGPDGTATHIRIDSPSGVSTGKVRLPVSRGSAAEAIMKRLSVRAQEAGSGTTLKGASRALTGKEDYLTNFKKSRLTSAETKAILAARPQQQMGHSGEDLSSADSRVQLPAPSPEEGAVPITSGLPRTSRGGYVGFRWNGSDGTATHFRVDSPSGLSTGKISTSWGKRHLTDEAKGVVQRLIASASLKSSVTSTTKVSELLTGKQAYLTHLKKKIKQTEAQAIPATRSLEEESDSQSEGGVPVTSDWPQDSRGAYGGARWNGPNGTATHIRVESPSGKSTGKIPLVGKKDSEAMEIMKRLSVRASDKTLGTSAAKVSQALTGKKNYLANVKQSLRTDQANAILEGTTSLEQGNAPQSQLLPGGENMPQLATATPEELERATRDRAAIVERLEKGDRPETFYKELGVTLASAQAMELAYKAERGRVPQRRPGEPLAGPSPRRPRLSGVAAVRTAPGASTWQPSTFPRTSLPSRPGSTSGVAAVTGPATPVVWTAEQTSRVQLMVERGTFSASDIAQSTGVSAREVRAQMRLLPEPQRQAAMEREVQSMRNTGAPMDEISRQTGLTPAEIESIVAGPQYRF